MPTCTVLVVHEDMFHQLPTLTTSVPPQTNYTMPKFWGLNLPHVYWWDFILVNFMNKAAFAKM